MTWQIFAAAAIAPLAVWLLWRVQGIAVDQVLRRALLKLLAGQRRLYSVVSWLGTLIHELSHMAILVVSGHGAKNLTVRTDGGSVQPRHSRRGPVAFLGFLAAAIAPLYIPPAMVLGGLLLATDLSIPWPVGQAGVDGAWNTVETMLLEFPVDLWRAGAGLDLAHWPSALLALFALIALPSSRPSYVKGSKFHGDEGDIAVVRRKIRRRPVPFLAFLAIIYASYFALTAWAPAIYWRTFAAIWAVALTGILFAVFGAVWWWLAARMGRTRLVLAPVPVVCLVAAQVIPRLTDAGWTLATINAVSMATFAVLAVLLAQLAPRRHW